MNFTRAATVALGLAIATQIACSDVAAPPAQPVPGELTVVLETPNADDQAILLRVTGSQMSGVSANGAYVLHTRAGTNDFKSALFGSLADGPLVRFSVPDVNRAGDYTVTILEVADAGNVLRGSLIDYRATIVKP